MSRLVGPPLPALTASTTVEALDSAAAADGGVVLVDLSERETRLPWAQVREEALRVAGGLLERGLQPGERAALVLPTGLPFLASFFGVQLAGGVPVPLYPPVRLGRMDEYAAGTARMLTAVDAAVVLTDSRVQLLLGRAVEQARPRLGCLAGVAGSPGPARAAAVDPLGCIQFSSGSTVDPKPVALSHHNLLSQVAALKALLKPEPAHPPHGVSWLPLYHDMGLVGCLLEALYYPGWLTLLPPEVFLARPALWLRALSRHRGTVSPAPNFAYGLCLKRVRDEEVQGIDLSAWRYALNGAEPVSPGTAEAFARRFARHGFRADSLMPVYGLSEATLAVTFTPPGRALQVARVDPDVLAETGTVAEGRRGIASVGTPVPGCEVEVRGEHGQALPEGQVGKVMVRGESVMQGYFGRPDATAEALRDGWLDTGDLGFVLEGELHISGRAKDEIIIRGANRAPQEFEEALEGAPGVRTGCVVAAGFVPEGEDDEQLLLLVETAGTVPPSFLDDVAKAVVSHTGVAPRLVVPLEPGTLPRTSSGKLRRRRALADFLAGTLRPPERVTWLLLGREMLRSALAHLRAGRRKQGQ